MDTGKVEKQYIVGVRPPKVLSREAMSVLASAKPSQKARKRVASTVRLPILDGAEIGI